MAAEVGESDEQSSGLRRRVRTGRLLTLGSALVFALVIGGFAIRGAIVGTEPAAPANPDLLTDDNFGATYWFFVILLTTMFLSFVVGAAIWLVSYVRLASSTNRKYWR